MIQRAIRLVIIGPLMLLALLAATLAVVVIITTEWVMGWEERSAHTSHNVTTLGDILRGGVNLVWNGMTS